MRVRGVLPFNVVNLTRKLNSMVIHGYPSPGSLDIMTSMKWTYHIRPIVTSARGYESLLSAGQALHLHSSVYCSYARVLEIEILTTYLRFRFSRLDISRSPHKRVVSGFTGHPNEIICYHSTILGRQKS
jgi:hypothetical protein